MTSQEIINQIKQNVPKLVRVGTGNINIPNGIDEYWAISVTNIPEDFFINARKQLNGKYSREYSFHMDSIEEATRTGFEIFRYAGLDDNKVDVDDNLIKEINSKDSNNNLNIYLCIYIEYRVV